LLDEIVSGSITDAAQLVRREHCTMRQINLTLSLALLATQVVKAAVEGAYPAASTSSACVIPTRTGPSNSSTSASISISFGTARI
jgi:hypothetical protein